MKRLVVNADDYGQSLGTNQAILKAHHQGILTSTSCMANMPAIEAGAAELSDAPKLGLGAHISLNVGSPVLSPTQLPALVDEQGLFHGSYLTHIRLSRRPDYLAQAELEIEAQIQRLLQLGYSLDHINGQSHLQMIPGLHRLFVAAALRHSLWLRNSKERAFGHPRTVCVNLLKNGLINQLSRLDQTSDKVEFFGIRMSGQMDRKTLLYYLKNNQSPITELLSHPAQGTEDPGYPLQPFVKAWLREPGREQELQGLIDPKVKAAVAENGFVLCTFKEAFATA